MKTFIARLRERPEVLLLLAALLLIAAALLRPSLSRSGSLHSFQLVFDITQSMNTRDQITLAASGSGTGATAASRLGAAKEAARQTLLDLPCGSRVGVSIFSEYRTLALFSPVEVCAHFSEISAALTRIDGRMSWAGASEIAKGVSFALRTQKALAERPLIVFFTDGHEAPPLDPRYRTRFDQAAKLHGVLVGVGGDRPVPIPKTGPDGQALGFWGPDDVMHDDPHNLGRGGSVKDERTVSEAGAPSEGKARGANEHLSSLREAYLQGLAREAGFAYLRLTQPEQTSAQLRALPPAKTASARIAIDWLPAAGALVLLLATLLVGALPRKPPPN